MPKMTVLEMTQDILNDMDSDEVNSINDTTEALQVAQIIKTTYYEILDGVDVWPHLDTLVQLESSGTTDRPTHMRMPETLQTLYWIKYNKKKTGATKEAFAEVKYKEPHAFMTLLNQRDSSASNVSSIVDDSSSVTLLIKNDTAPTYWTSFNDEWIIFDSYDSAVDSTLQTSKTQAEGPRDVSFTLEDTFTPDLPSKAFSYLLAEAKSVAFNAIKQMANAKEEQRSKRQRYRLAGNKRRGGGPPDFASYGRRTR